ncbi:hypothetical protein ACIBG7_12655 [Nonomuraea sp. NPDC050328]|uniref:hypothetical protein n=1 Tax=Nonomuraea sp. NPDC050328 TaxID=3364361 RepID=UPI0037A1EDF1
MQPISSMSREYLNIFVGNALGSEPVEIALTVPGVEPADDAWHPAIWGDVSDHGAVARLLIGPGAVPLSDGTYQAWVRVTRPDERPVLPSGLVPII